MIIVSFSVNMFPVHLEHKHCMSISSLCIKIVAFMDISEMVNGFSVEMNAIGSGQMELSG